MPNSPLRSGRPVVTFDKGTCLLSPAPGEFRQRLSHRNRERLTFTTWVTKWIVSSLLYLS